MILPRNGITAVNTDSVISKINDCTPNNRWYVSEVGVNGASKILL